MQPCKQVPNILNNHVTTSFLMLEIDVVKLSSALKNVGEAYLLIEVVLELGIRYLTFSLSLPFHTALIAIESVHL